MVKMKVYDKAGNLVVQGSLEPALLKYSSYDQYLEYYKARLPYLWESSMGEFMPSIVSFLMKRPLIVMEKTIMSGRFIRNDTMEGINSPMLDSHRYGSRAL